MTRLEIARDEFADLTEVLGHYEGRPPAPGAPESLTYDSLLARRADLLHEIRLLEGHADLEIRFIGGAESTNRVRADFLGKILWDIQGTLGAVAQTFVHGERGARGVLPRDILNASMLRVTSSAPGSFVLLMDGPFDRPAQLTLEGGEEIHPFDEALTSIVQLIDASEHNHPGEIGRVLAQIGSPRAFAHIRALVRHLVGSQTSAVFVHRPGATNTPHEARLNLETAGRLESVLATTVQTTETVTIAGRLSGVLWRSGIFELETIGGQVLRGRVTNSLRDAVQGQFDRLVDAVLERTSTTLVDGGEHLTWRLVALDPILQVIDATQVRAVEARPRELT